MPAVTTAQAVNTRQTTKKSSTRSVARRRSGYTTPLLDDSFEWMRGADLRWIDTEQVVARVDPEAVGFRRGTFQFWRRETIAWLPLPPISDTDVGGTTDRLITSEKVLITDGQQAKRWQPLREQPALFRRFTDINPTEGRPFIEFARQYGTLGCRVPIARVEPTGNAVVAHGQEGERRNDWITAHSAMQEAVLLWDLSARKNLRAGDLDALEQALSSSRVFISDTEYLEAPTPIQTTDKRNVVGMLRREAQDTLRKIASYYLQGAPPAQEWSRGRPISNPLRAAAPLASVVYDPTARHPFALRLRPQSLLSAMWLQFADAIQLGRTYARCAYCNKWFLRSRSDRQLCSASCNTMASRKKGDK